MDVIHAVGEALPAPQLRLLSAVASGARAHPYAAAFPMMNDDELAALATDIHTRGLQQPMVYNAKGLLVDGRNPS